MIPMGGGTFIIPIKAAIRKRLEKKKAIKLFLKLEEDLKEYQLDKELVLCLKDEPIAYGKFKNFRSRIRIIIRNGSVVQRHRKQIAENWNWINGMLNDQTMAEMLKANRELKIK